MEPLRTEGLDHVALTVSDLERSSTFYSHVLGLKRKYEPGHEPSFVLAGGSGLALFRSDSYPVAEGVGGASRIRVMHVAFRVDRAQFDRAREELPSIGIDPRFEDHGSVHSIYFEDPDGHQIELCTYEV